MHGQIKDKGKLIEGYGNKYYVDKQGNIWNKELKRYISLFKHNYMYVQLSYNGIYKKNSVHRLVAKTYLPNPNNLPHVHHIDNNPYNNNLENLMWVTVAENVHYSYELMSQIRNFNTCVLKYKDNYIRIFKSVNECCRYCKNKFNLSYTGMNKYRRDKHSKYKIIVLSKLNGKRKKVL